MENKTLSEAAHAFAEEAHEGQYRIGGLPYIVHPERVAALVRKYKGDSSETESLAAAAYCHDLLEDTDVTYYRLVDHFGYCVASLVMEVTSNPDMKAGVGSKKEYLAYKLQHMTSWALVIKLCDRLDNISDMGGTTKKWKERYIEETLFILDYIEARRQLTPTVKAIIADLRDAIDYQILKNSISHDVFSQKCL